MLSIGFQEGVVASESGEARGSKGGEKSGSFINFLTHSLCLLPSRVHFTFFSSPTPFSSTALRFPPPFLRFSIILLSGSFITLFFFSSSLCSHLSCPFLALNVGAKNNSVLSLTHS